ncbi:MAG TPA: ATP-binding protein [Oligoflexus sp.]|uniref:ATP-binding protein n=1 Tax=Oligoflexus sp. TaxID=1971216 RepID=UPI002D23FB0A|nr:ATP-binding protein [Oligoflexus sp.]HYX38774.1 ATP-binding protein [Oligoflexus sp.]
MASRWRGWIQILWLCCLSQTTEAAALFTVDRFRLQESLDAHSEMLISASAEAADVLTLPADQWQPVSDAYRFANNPSLIWMKTTVQNRLQVPVQVTVRLQTSFFSNARFFVLDNNILTEQTHASSQTERLLSLADLRPSHTLTLDPGTSRVVLVSIESEAPHDCHWELRDTESHRRESFQYALRWIFLLAALLLVALFAAAQGLTQRRSIPLSLALFVFLSLLFLVRMSHWPLLAMFWEPLGEALPPLNHILCLCQASLLILLKRLSYGIEPKRTVQKLYGFGLGFLVLDLSLIAVLHQHQSLLFMLPSEVLMVGLLFGWDRLASRQKHPRAAMIRLLLGQQCLLFVIHILILGDAFPLWRLPEATLWIHVLSSCALLFMGLTSSRTQSQPTPASAPTPEASVGLKPEPGTNLLHEQWLHAEKMAALGTFTNGLANELNNPLAIIAGHRFRLSSMIDSRSFNIHEFEKSLGKVDQAVNRMIAVIDALKVYSQEPQGQEIFKTFSLRETIKYTIDLCRDKVVSRGIKLATPELGDATMEGHQGQMIQVLLILLDNAIDALEQVPDKTIRIELQPLPDSVRIAVMDSGPGVPLGLRNKIWDPFFTTKDPFRHKGLGLSIASGIVSNHRGRLGLDETTPETRFVVELPRTRRPLGLVQTDGKI